MDKSNRRGAGGGQKSFSRTDPISAPSAQPRGPRAATRGNVKSLSVRSMYKIDRRGGPWGGSKNRSLGIYQKSYTRTDPQLLLCGLHEKGRGSNAFLRKHTCLEINYALTFPRGNFLVNSAVLLDSPNTKSAGTVRLAPLYFAAIKAFWARKLSG